MSYQLSAISYQLNSNISFHGPSAIIRVFSGISLKKGLLLGNDFHGNLGFHILIHSNGDFIRTQAFNRLA